MPIPRRWAESYPRKIFMSKNKGKAEGIVWWAVLFWLVLWEIASRIIGWDIILVSPVRVVWKLAELVREAFFWKTILTSLCRIMGGFLLALFTGTVLAGVASKSGFLRKLLQPFMVTVRAVPVASFIVLALIMFSTKTLSTLIAFLMATPVIYAAVLTGIGETDKELLEAADVNGADNLQRVRFVYAPQMWNAFVSACKTAMGLSWKAGIAAEVIGMPQHTIGAYLKDAKTYLDTPSLFAWTLTIVLLSLLTERIFSLLTGCIQRWFC